MRKFISVSLVTILLGSDSSLMAQTPAGTTAKSHGYADVNGLKVYYERHGAGKPLVVLHGAFGWAMAYPQLSANRELIVIEQQGHAHTADVDRPLSYNQMADDTAAVLRYLRIEQADVFGYSMGGNIGLALAIRHPELVRKLAIFGSHASKIADAFDTESLKQFKSLPADFAPAVLKDPYDKFAPNPADWPKLVAKIKKMELEFKGFAREDMQAIKSHVLVALGDRDAVRAEHAVEMYRLIPHAELAIFPKADHFMIFQSPDKLFPTIKTFLDAPTP